ncbi:hypothetical protein ACYULU_13195 [Breznakiellaceae bacterium SP9]
MKFKFIVIVFDSIILLFLLGIYLFLFIGIGYDFGLSFWQINWPFSLVLCLLIIVCLTASMYTSAASKPSRCRFPRKNKRPGLSTEGRPILFTLRDALDGFTIVKDVYALGLVF